MPKAFTPNDIYFYRAQERGLRARSAFKLEEILYRFPKIMIRQKKVLDLGSAPGSFLQILKTYEPTLLMGIDLKKVKPIKRARIFQGDIFSDKTAETLKIFAPFHLITSDLAPNTTGQPDVDQFHSVELCERVLELSKTILRPKGNLILKIFTGEDFDDFWAFFRGHFSGARIFKPKACRDRSREVFLVGQGFLGQKKSPVLSQKRREEKNKNEFLFEE